MSDNITVNFVVNGEETRAQVRADMNLMHFLRDYLGYTGVKNGCTSGHCGSCTIILDGEATRACLVKMKMPRLNGAQIETIEALSTDGSLHPLQHAFIEEGAVQCGFCTPGMIMSAKALLAKNPDPSDDDIKAALQKNNNLCRCTGYVNIFSAIKSAGEMMRKGITPGPLEPENQHVRSTRLLREAIDLVTGTTQFGDDIDEQDMLYGKILWSQFPHADILDINTTHAEAMQGVELVITAQDIPGKNQCGIVERDQPAIATDRVRYIGDSVAAVFATSREIAEAAVQEIEVEYRQLPGVFSPEDAARPDAPRIHEKGNLAHHAKIVRGDVEKAFKNCAVIVEGHYSTPYIEHGFLEPEAGIALPGEDGGVTIRYGTQSAFDIQTQLCEILDMPKEKVRVVQIPVGGAFGGKEDMIIEQYLALGALKSRKPVKITLDRKESLRVHVKRHPAWMHYKTGADENGRIVAIEAYSTIDTGAYMSLGFDVLENMLVFGAGPYFVPNLRLEGWAWHTNNVPCGAMRGFGVNQVAVALEQQLDEIARQLGIDPFKLRIINALDVGFPTAADHLLDEGVVSIKETIVAAQETFLDSELPKSTGRTKIGYGVASAVKNIGFGHGLTESAGVIVEMDSAGEVVVKHSQHEYGQGAVSGLAQFAATELGIPVSQIQLIGPDTAVTPHTGPTTASRQTYMMGNATLLACKSLKDELFGRAAELLDQIPGKLKFEGSRIVDDELGKSIELADLGEHFIVEKRYEPGKTIGILEDEVSRFGSPDFESRPTHWCYAYNTQVAVVEVNEDTGAIKILKIISANDLGKVINRAAVVGQIHGGVMMGVGYALSERYIVENGYNTTDTLHKIRMPGAEQTPEIIPVLVEVSHPEGPYGVKGFAEAPSLATAPAILNAIYDAVGVRVRDLPADKKTLKTLLDQRNQN